MPAFALALNTLGAVSVHMPVTGGAHEYDGVLRITEAKGVVVPGEFRGNDFVSMIEGIPGGFDGLETRVTVGRDDADPGWVTFDGLIGEAPADAPATGRAGVGLGPHVLAVHLGIVGRSEGRDAQFQLDRSDEHHRGADSMPWGPSR